MITSKIYFQSYKFSNALKYSRNFSTTFYKNGRSVLRRTPYKIIEEEPKKANDPLLNISKSFYERDDLFEYDNEGNLLDKNQKSIQTKLSKSDHQNSVKEKKIPNFEILKSNEEFIRHIINGKNKNREESVLILEGANSILDAINADIPLKTLYFDKVKTLLKLPDLLKIEKKGVLFKKLNMEDFSLFSELKTPPGLLGVFERPDCEKLNDYLISKQKETALPLVLVLDQIRDPSNMGLIIRSAAACGIQKIIVMEGCVDVWEGKVIRSSMGAIFRIPIFTEIQWQNLEEHLPLEKFIGVYRVLNEENGKQYDSVNYFNKLNDINILIIDEPKTKKPKHQDVDNFLSKHNGTKICINSSNEVNLSSSITASVLLFEMRRQFMKTLNLPDA